MSEYGLRVGCIGQDASLADWLSAKRYAHADDPCFVAPLDLLEKRRVSSGANSFFQRGEASFFVAFRGRQPVGRISAQIIKDDRAFLDDQIGSFGFFDVADDPEAAHLLLQSARTWLSTKGARRLRGPFNLTINAECGCQIDAFDVRPSYLMPQSRPWTAGLLEACGLAKVMDMHAWRMNGDAVPARLERIVAMGGDLSTIKVRPVRKDRFAEDIRLLAEIFNDAWSKNWGFLPMLPREIDELAAELKMIYRSSYGYFVELDGKPVGVLIGVPNLNEAIADFGGRLLPFNGIRLLSRLFSEGIRTSRIPLVGIRQAYQSGPTGALLTAALAQAALTERRRRPIEWFEFSWVLETNIAARRYLTAMGARPAVTYRLFEGEVAV